MKIPNDLLRAVREHRVVPFVGAGVSLSVKPRLFPTWNELIYKLATALEDEGYLEEAIKVKKLTAAEDYLRAAEVAYNQLGAYRFNRLIRTIFRQRRPMDGEFNIIESIWGIKPKLVITTNYDDSLRWATPPEVQVVTNDQPEELALLEEATSEWPWLWYLHGTVHRLGTIILAGTHYKKLYNNQANQYESALFQLHRVLSSNSFMYIGFSLSDMHVIEQIVHVLDITKGKGAPSYALMKKGSGDKGSLWSNYNIQLIEYEDHGRPLAELLKTIALDAFNPRTSAAAELASKSTLNNNPILPRPHIEDECIGLLRNNGRLILLAPRHGGARTVAQRIAESSFGDNVTWLSPPSVPNCTKEEYYQALTNNTTVTDFIKFANWLKDRGSQSAGNHLVVLRHDGGPIDHLKTLGYVLRKVWEERRTDASGLKILVVGGAHCARLIGDTSHHSLFSGAPVRHIPSLSVDEVQAILNNAGLDGARFGAIVFRATGGHPGLVREAIAQQDSLDYAALSERFARGPSLHGAIRIRISEDDSNGEPTRRHSRTVLSDLLSGKTVRRLCDVCDELSYAEARLYFDGILIEDKSGDTAFRCVAAHKAAESVLSMDA